MSKGRAAAIDRLSHMRDSCVAIADYVGRGRSTFDADSAVRDAILYQVVVLGEAAKGALQADPSLATELPEIEWSPLARMRTALRITTGLRTAKSCGRPPPPRCRRCTTLSPARLPA